MNFGSVCSGIEAASVAWHPLGWDAAWFSEIENFPCAVLAHHYPNTPNLGDMTKFTEWPNADIDVLVGGTPCQSFSVAGLRKGLADPRGNLMLTFGAIAERYRPRWLVWENVPGVLSSNGGKDFGAFLGMLAELGYGVAYRVLDAQYFGVAQRRRRVFVVGYLGDWRPPAAVLFERQSLSGDSAPSRKTGETIAPTFRAGAPNGSLSHGQRSGDTRDELIVPTLANCLRAKSNDPHRADTGNYIAHTLRAQYDASEDGMGRGTPLVSCQAIPISTMAAVSRHGDDRIGLGIGKPGAPSATLSKAHSHAVAISLRGREGGATAELGGEIQNALRASKGGGDKAHVLSSMSVRRLTPRECERLQGFPDDYTLIPYRGKPAADGPRYKALGNSMAVPVMRWIGERIERTEFLILNGS